MNVKVACYDVEHDGDVEAARSEICKAGGKILKSKINLHEDCDGEAYFLVEIPDTVSREQFRQKLDDLESMCEVL